MVKVRKNIEKEVQINKVYVGRQMGMFLYSLAIEFDSIFIR